MALRLYAGALALSGVVAGLALGDGGLIVCCLLALALIVCWGVASERAVKARAVRPGFKVDKRTRRGWEIREASGLGAALRTIGGPADAASIVREAVGVDIDRRECFVALYVNTRNGLLGAPYVVSIGSLSASIVHPREVLRPAIERSAAAIVVAHNHPSNDVCPSPEDVSLTQRLEASCRILGIQLLDHVVVGHDTFASLKERGELSGLATASPTLALMAELAGVKEGREDYDPEEWAERCDMFQDPGGRSALRRASKSNPRNLPCPTCHKPNRLTPADRRRGYQCDECADRDEGRGMCYERPTSWGSQGVALVVWRGRGFTVDRVTASQMLATAANHGNAVECIDALTKAGRSLGPAYLLDADDPAGLAMLSDLLAQRSLFNEEARETPEPYGPDGPSGELVRAALWGDRPRVEVVIPEAAWMPRDADHPDGGFLAHLRVTCVDGDGTRSVVDLHLEALPVVDDEGDGETVDDGGARDYLDSRECYWPEWARVCGVRCVLIASPFNA